MALEKQIVDNALFYEKNGKAQVSSTSGDCVSWYKKIHQHFQKDVIPHMKQSQEHFVEYHPVWFSFGESTSYNQGISSGRMYRHTYGTYGTGYICFTDKNIYLTALDALTQEYPLYPSGSKGFFLGVLEGMIGERNDRKAYSGDKTWTIDYPSVVGAQITQVEGSSTEIVYIKTTSVDWQIHQHFSDTLPEMLTAIKMGSAGKLASIWAKPEAKNSDIPSLLKKLSELKEAGVITEAEFQQKKQQLLNQM
jgi:hypothetical protein